MKGMIDDFLPDAMVNVKGGGEKEGMCFRLRVRSYCSDSVLIKDCDENHRKWDKII
jgi:hypothetical protein